MFTRAEERETARQYQRLWQGGGAKPALERFLMSPAGIFVFNTPLFLLPKQIGIKPEQRVLEIGSGRGANLRFLATRIPFRQTPVGVDVSIAAIDRGRREDAAAPVELVAAIASRLPFAAESFDLILCTNVVKHFGDAVFTRFLFECHRALRPGGRLVVWEFAPTRSSRLNRFHQWLLTRNVTSCRLRGFGDFVDLAIESAFATMEILTLRPFLFPPIPRTAFVLNKGERDDHRELESDPA